VPIHPRLQGGAFSAPAGKLLMFPFANPCNARLFKANNQIYIQSKKTLHCMSGLKIIDINRG
jgi:hypothetical protein